MPNLNQITDSINKSYVKLPDGSFAEKIVVVNSDGTAVSGGGGGGVVSQLVNYPVDGSTTNLTLAAPTQLGQIYFISGGVANLSVGSPSGYVRITTTLTSGASGIIMLGVASVPGSGVYTFSGFSGYVEIPSGFFSMQITYAGQGTFDGTVYDIYESSYWKYGG